MASADRAVPLRNRCHALKEHDTNAVAQDLYDQLKAKGVEVVIDDRDMGPGPKFKDCDFIGLPYRIVVGRGLADNNVEFKDRNADAAEDIAVDTVVEKVVSLVLLLWIYWPKEGEKRKAKKSLGFCLGSFCLFVIVGV